MENSTKGGRENENYSTLRGGIIFGANKQDNGTNLDTEGEKPLLSKDIAQPTRKIREI